MSNATATAFSDAIKTVYEKRLLTRALPRMVHSRWATRARLNKMGAWEVRKYAALSAVSTPLTSGVTPVENAAPALSKTTITP
jgi:hypothetical protein